MSTTAEKIEAERAAVEEGLVKLRDTLREAEDQVNVLIAFNGVRSRDIELARDHIDDAISRIRRHGNQGRWKE